MNWDHVYTVFTKQHHERGKQGRWKDLKVSVLPHPTRTATPVLLIAAAALAMTACNKTETVLQSSSRASSPSWGVSTTRVVLCRPSLAAMA